MSLFERTPDPPERTAADRERARAEREARRAAREGRAPAPPPPPPPEPVAEPLSPERVAEPAPPKPEPVLEPEPATAPEPVRPPEAAPTPQRTRREPVLQAHRQWRAARRAADPARPAAPPPAASAPPMAGGAAGSRGDTLLDQPGKGRTDPNGRAVGDRGDGRRRWRPRLRPPRDPADPAGGGPAGGRPRRRPRVAAAVAGVLVLALAWFLASLFQPFHGAGHGAVRVRVPANAGVGAVGAALAKSGVVRSKFFFTLRARLSGRGADLKPGLYTLKRDMSYSAAIAALVKGPAAAKTISLTMREGRSIHEIDRRLKDQQIPLAGSYAAAARRSRLLDPRRYGAPASTPNLEGFLFPATYEVRVGAPVSTLVDKQLQVFKQRFARVDLREATKRKHLRPYDVLIIASMIESEVSLPRERPIVAAVIYNRIKEGIPLGIDATTRYEHNNWTQPLRSADFDNSPYDTRHHKDLPPTPIGNPGLASINAAAHPARVSYLYYVVKPCGNGVHVFSKTYSQFLKDADRYSTARAARGGRSPSACR